MDKLCHTLTVVANNWNVSVTCVNEFCQRIKRLRSKENNIKMLSGYSLHENIY